MCFQVQYNQTKGRDVDAYNVLGRTGDPASRSLPTEDAERSNIELQAASITRWLLLPSVLASPLAMPLSDASISPVSMDRSAAAPSTSQLSAATEEQLQSTFQHTSYQNGMAWIGCKAQGGRAFKLGADRGGVCDVRTRTHLEERRRGSSATREPGRGESVCGERASTRRRRRAASAAGGEEELLVWRLVLAAARRTGKKWRSKEAEEGDGPPAAALSSPRFFLFLLFPFRFMAFGGYTHPPLQQGGAAGGARVLDHPPHPESSGLARPSGPMTDGDAVTSENPRSFLPVASAAGLA